ncbi:ethanolamine phosphate phosphodiesterase, partial [Lecanoromycetidae sp. Uapishka_2]
MGTHLRDLFLADIPRILQSYRKRLDLLGNDYYLAHIYRTLQWMLHPTHVAVVGDLIGSQWVSDEEFERRGARFWQRVFRNGRRVEDEISNGISVEALSEGEAPAKEWSRRVINVAGNHDIGYAGDITPEKMQRFERVFGKANWETRFNLPTAAVDSKKAPELRLIVLNSLNLDAPVLETDLQSDTYKFVNDAISASRPVEDRNVGTILLTHLPLHKQAGVCVDAPLFEYHDEKHGGGVREQNHLSYDASKGLLEGIFGMNGDISSPGGGLGRKGIILTGHDHEGCDVVHQLRRNGDTDYRWIAENMTAYTSRVHTAEAIPSIREITVRSMMGDFGGNAGLLSAWFDHDGQDWKFDYSTCAVGTQHIWWAIHILDLVTIILLNYVGWSIFGSTKDKIGVDTTKEKKTQ